MPIICDGIQSHKDTALGAIFSLSGYEIGDYGIEVWVKYFFGQLCPNGHWEDKSLKYFVIFTMLLFFLKGGNNNLFGGGCSTNRFIRTFLSLPSASSQVPRSCKVQFGAFLFE